MNPDCPNPQEPVLHEPFCNPKPIPLFSSPVERKALEEDIAMKATDVLLEALRKNPIPRPRGLRNRVLDALRRLFSWMADKCADAQKNRKADILRGKLAKAFEDSMDERFRHGPPSCSEDSDPVIVETVEPESVIGGAPRGQCQDACCCCHGDLEKQVDTGWKKYRLRDLLAKNVLTFDEKEELKILSHEIKDDVVILDGNDIAVANRKPRENVADLELAEDWEMDY